MRLLQLTTAPDRLIDLHPNVTIVNGLDADARRLLGTTILGLAKGTAPGPTGLLEAHGLLFDLSDEMLVLLDVAADGLRPVVTAADLPTLRHDPRARERIGAERALGEIDERWATAGEHHRRLQLTYAAAAEALEHARRNANEAEAGAAERIRLIDELTARLDHFDERRRRLLEDQAERGPQAEEAAARRHEVEAATSEVRSRHQETALACSALAAQLDQARLGLDPAAVAEAEAAIEALAQVTAEVEAERAAEQAITGVERQDEEPPAERLARVQARIEEIDMRLAAFGPTEVFEVANALDQLRALEDGEPVASPEAMALADQLSALDEDLAATAGVGATSGDLAAGRTRLDDARQGLLETEQAVRNPELDRDLVDRLELAHADLLDAQEKADGRFAGARAERRVEVARAAEHALLDELGFVSYSDYMMGYSLLNVDPEKEAALEAARVELSAAEDGWRVLEAETEAELARAERMERRRLLVDEARALLGRPVPAGAVVDELHAHRVPATLPPELIEQLHHSLDHAGLALSGEDLSLAELMLLAGAWLDEASDSTVREEDLRRELGGLSNERSEALAAVEEEAAAAAASGPTPEEERHPRLSGAAAAADAAEGRRRRHLEAEAAVTAVAAELAAAADAERRAAEASADAEAAVAEAVNRAEGLAADVARIEGELRALGPAELEANEHLQSLSDHEWASPDELAAEVAAADAAYAAADARLQEASVALAALVVERTQAQEAVASFDDVAEPLDEASIAEEIEWYLLARLAAQRAVCLGGSLPLLLEGALDGLDEEQLGHVLGRLERIADAVQVIVVSDDPLAASWALLAGQDRAAVVRPQPV